MAKKGGMLIIFTVGLGDPDCFDTPYIWGALDHQGCTAVGLRR